MITKVRPGVEFDGAIVRKATVNNAKWMYDRKIGPGAVVRLVRSGEIIPKIIDVVKPGKLKLPPASVGKYQWDENGTHFVLLDKSVSVEAKTRGIVRFFRGVEVDLIGPGVAAKLYEGGFTTVLSILRATKEDFLQLPGIQDKGATKLYAAVQVLYTRGVELPKLMEASGAFPRGMGEKRIKQIAKIEPDLLGLAELSPKALTSLLLKIPMFSDTMAAVFVEGIYPFVKWFKKTKIKIVQPAKVKVESNKLNGLRVSWTGYRSPEQENAVKVSGGEVVSFGSRTQVLLYSPTGKSSTKVDKAQAKGIATLTWDQFSKKHKL
jgi:NAD-dependent DNA ligase